MNQTATTRTHLPDPATSPELFEGLLTRRVSAHLIDLVIIGAIVIGLSIVGLLAGFLTFGLAWLALAFVIPIALAIYYAATLGSSRRATIGMQFMDIVLTPANGKPLDGWMALLHAGLFYVSVCVAGPLPLLVVLFTPRRQMLHDLVMGTLMVRKSPMQRHWQGFGRGSSPAY